MHRTRWIAAALMLGFLASARAQGGGETLAWLYQELGGSWTAKAAGQPASGAGAPGETSFKHQGAGVFRVHSSGPGGLLAQWNGRQVRVGGPLRTDEQGWTYFSLEGEPSRIGMRSDGKKVVEVRYADPTQRVELTQR